MTRESLGHVVSRSLVVVAMIVKVIAMIMKTMLAVVMMMMMVAKAHAGFTRIMRTIGLSLSQPTHVNSHRHSKLCEEAQSP